MPSRRCRRLSEEERRCSISDGETATTNREVRRTLPLGCRPATAARRRRLSATARLACPTGWPARAEPDRDLLGRADAARLAGGPSGDERRQVDLHEAEHHVVCDERNVVGHHMR